MKLPLAEVEGLIAGVTAEANERVSSLIARKVLEALA